MAHRLSVLLVTLLLLSRAHGAPAPDIASLPKPTSYVTDRQHVLAPNERRTLTRKLVAWENARLAQGVIYIAAEIPNGEPMEALTLRMANRWKIGHKGVDDGLIIFVFLKEKAVRIELGRGMERVLSNDEAQQVIDRDMVPQFRQGHYGTGLIAAVDDLSARLRAHRRGPR